MTGQEIREAFLEYFQKQGHTVVPSSPLIPKDDPTLLFTNAGMVQFKDTFLGKEIRPYSRAVSCQKCVRAGGKHNDLENVGHTARHHTFFEMLGNFSFGDYFKQDAIRFGWEFLTVNMELPVDKLWVTVFTKDDEAEKIWRQVGVSADRIVRLGEKDNFWSMGEVGPCGPCSEILIDQGESFSCGKPDCRVGCDCDRYLELWNLVFMQYNRDGQGQLSPLPKPSIDTGMGLERITAVKQHVAGNFESDLFRPIINVISELAGVDYNDNHEHDVSLHVVADHARAITFLINDQVMPSNEGRGYVLRRIIRRAVRHGRLLGIDRAFLYKMVGVVVGQMRGCYPDLPERREYIASVTLNEEERFSHTLEQGTKIINELVKNVRASGARHVDGKEVFKLYDTYGFPIDLTREILEENDLTFNQAEFEAAMRQQQEQARKHWKGAAKEVNSVYKELAGSLDETEFVRDVSELDVKVLALIKRDEAVSVMRHGEDNKAEIVLEKTPFYPEKGGQMADTGWINIESGRFKVENVLEVLPGFIIHQGVLESGFLAQDQTVTAKVDDPRRRQLACNHTATHILQAVLRQVLGDHIKQAGSLVAPERLRFDFTHFARITPRELKRVEALVNEHVRANYSVEIQSMDIDEAIASGATALFDEKYSQRVRVVSVGGVSKELCGGTHLRASGEIGLFKLVGESSVAAGIRRIEAVTGPDAYKYVARESEQLAGAASLLRCSPVEVVARTEKLLENIKRQEKELARLKDKLVAGQVDEYLSAVREIKGIKILSAQVHEAADVEGLRSLSDLLKQRLSSGVIVLGAEINQKVALLTIVSKDLVPALHAGNIVKQVARITGGGGGGRPDMAQAGGKDVSRLKTALDEVYTIVGKMSAG